MHPKVQGGEFSILLLLSLAHTSWLVDQLRLWPSFANPLLFVTDYELATRWRGPGMTKKRLW